MPYFAFVKVTTALVMEWMMNVTYQMSLVQGLPVQERLSKGNVLASVSTYISREKLNQSLIKSIQLQNRVFRIKLISSFTAMDINGNQVEKFGCSTSINYLPLEILLPMVEKYLQNPDEIRTMTMAMTMNHAGKLLVRKVFQLHLYRHLHLHLHAHRTH